MPGSAVRFSTVVLRPSTATVVTSDYSYRTTSTVPGYLLYRTSSRTQYSVDSVFGNATTVLTFFLATDRPGIHRRVLQGKMPGRSSGRARGRRGGRGGRGDRGDRRRAMPTFEPPDLTQPEPEPESDASTQRASSSGSSSIMTWPGGVHRKWVQKSDAGLTREPTSQTPCRFGAACTRPDCWFSHPPGHPLGPSAGGDDTPFYHFDLERAVSLHAWPPRRCCRS